MYGIAGVLGYIDRVVRPESEHDHKFLLSLTHIDNTQRRNHPARPEQLAFSIMAVDTSNSTEAQPVQSRLNHNQLPRVEYSLRDHKLAIAINWGILFLSSGALPIVLYFSLRYGGNVSLSTSK